MKLHYLGNTASHVLMSLVFVGVCLGRPLYVLAADPNACIQSDYRNTMDFEIPYEDPNDSFGAILGPIPNDSNSWNVAEGAWKRDWAKYCDPEGDPIAIAYLGGTSPALISMDVASSKWSFSSIVVQGINVWRFETSDGKATRKVTIMAWGVKNESPVLQ